MKPCICRNHYGFAVTIAFSTIVLFLTAICFPTRAVDGVAVTCRNPTGNTELRNTPNRDGEIWKRIINKSVVTDSVKLFAGPATNPRISPNGQQVVFVRGSDSMICIMPINGGTITPICKSHRWSIVHWPVDNWIYFSTHPKGDCSLTGDDTIYRVHPVAGSQKEFAHKFIHSSSGNGMWFFSWDVSSDLNRFDFRTADGCSNGDGGATWYDATLGRNDTIRDGGQGNLGDGFAMCNQGGACNWPCGRCGVGMSFDGRYVWSTDDGHSSLIIQKFLPGVGVDPTAVKTLCTTGPVQPAGSGHAVNDTAWITYSSSQLGYQCFGNCQGSATLTQELVNWVTGERMSLGEGDCGDFFVGSFASTPTINLSQSSLTFSATQGGTVTADTVLVANGGSGTLDPVTTPIQIQYSQGSGWLAVNRSGSENAQKLVNTITMTGLAVNTYHATVTVGVGNAVPSTNTYTVTLTVAPQGQSLTSISISPKNPTVNTLSSLTFSATALDQNGVATVPQPVMKWALSGAQGASIDSTKGIFHSQQLSGDFTVSVSAAGFAVTAATKVTVIRPITIVAPLQGSSFKVGDTLTVKWTLLPAKTSTGIAIYFTANNGKNWFAINSTIIANGNTAFYDAQNVGVYKWVIPPVFYSSTDSTSTTSQNCMISIDAPYEEGRPKDVSGVFTIGTGSSFNRGAWTATASSSNSGDVPAKALDNNRNSRWSNGAPQTSDQWFVVDMKEEASISKVTLISSGGDFARGYQVFVSVDSVHWGNAVATGSGSSDSISISFTPQTCRYIRIVQTGTSTSWWSINELFVNGPTDATAVAKGAPITRFARDNSSRQSFYTITGRKIDKYTISSKGVGLYISATKSKGSKPISKQIIVK